MLPFVVYFAGGGVSTGKVIQGFPEKEWNESPFVDSIATVSLRPDFRRLLYFSFLFVLVLSAPKLATVKSTPATFIFYVCPHG